MVHSNRIDFTTREMFFVTFKKKLTAMLFGLVLAIGLAACGNGESGDNANSDKNNDEKQEDKSDKSTKDDSSNESDGGDSKSKSANTDIKESGDVAAVVNGEEIPMKKFNDQLMSQANQMSQSGQELKESQVKQLKSSIMQQLINTELILQKAEENDITASEDKVKKQFNQIKEQNGDNFQKLLEQNDLTEEELKNNIKKNLKIQQFIDKNTEEVEVTEKELKAEYDKMKQQYEAMNKQSDKEMEVPKFEDAKKKLKDSVKKKKENEQVTKLLKELKKNSEIEKKVNV
ncbi:hypothetical protein GLW08_00375 [Pontibacillus yanchengensis]|uniref:Uncharacterized protein n=1 Tax=Pontibacillus yanchengensis TaxID=462910 RepID=A0ACC7VC71_9BACI|nr:hypothetical protein [Pontibacillus yanchengensis]